MHSLKSNQINIKPHTRELITSAPNTQYIMSGFQFKITKRQHYKRQKKTQSEQTANLRRGLRSGRYFGMVRPRTTYILRLLMEREQRARTDG